MCSWSAGVWIAWSVRSESGHYPHAGRRSGREGAGADPQPRVLLVAARRLRLPSPRAQRSSPPPTSSRRMRTSPLRRTEPTERSPLLLPLPPLVPSTTRVSPELPSFLRTTFHPSLHLPLRLSSTFTAHHLQISFLKLTISLPRPSFRLVPEQPTLSASPSPPFLHTLAIGSRTIPSPSRSLN